MKRSMNLLKDLQPYFYCTDAANLQKIRVTGEIRATIHHRHGEGIFLRSFPVFAKKKSQTIVEDSFGSEIVVTETTETQEYAIPIYLTDSEVSLQLDEQDGSVIYHYKEPVLYLPRDTKVITKKGDRTTLNCKVNSSNNLTGYDRVNKFHSEEMWIAGLAAVILLTFLVTVVKDACGLLSPETSFALVMLVSFLLCFAILTGVLLYVKLKRKTSTLETERQKAM